MNQNKIIQLQQISNSLCVSPDISGHTFDCCDSISDHEISLVKQDMISQ